ncbi:MAG: hypothetical protein IPJ13_31895 [Saprospiraceae bacterium]|nr:hypothetical protein [Saprospiraceae bacterium]
MDIKHIWIKQSRRYAYVLTIIDTFTRYVLCYSVGYSMRTTQVRQHGNLSSPPIFKAH